MLRQLQGLLFAAAFLVVAIILAVAAREGTGSFQDCIKTQDYELIGRIFAFYCTARFLETHNAVITAISTVLLTFVTGGLVWVGYQQIRTTRFQLRAYVFPESMGLFDGTMLNPPQPNRANEPGIVFLWKNTGQTPASNVISWGQIAVIEPINEHTLVVPPLKNVFAAHLGANAVANKSLWFGRPLTVNEIADVRVAARAVYFYGRIEYEDIFRKKRWTNFRLAYAGQFPPPPTGVTFSVCEKGNEAY